MIPVDLMVARRGPGRPPKREARDFRTVVWSALRYRDANTDVTSDAAFLAARGELAAAIVRWEHKLPGHADVVVLSLPIRRPDPAWRRVTDAVNALEGDGESQTPSRWRLYAACRSWALTAVWRDRTPTLGKAVGA